jgi:hypothetical protein
VYESDSNTEHEAVTRLFELVRNGDTDNCEFSQLDSMVYERLLRAYGADDTSATRVHTARVQVERSLDA